MTRFHKHLGLLALLFSLAIFSGCVKDNNNNNNDDNEQENITTVRVNIADLSGLTASFIWTDPEGDGSPVIDPIELNIGTTYTITVEFIDDSRGSFSNLTSEVEGESTDHLVCYSSSGGLSVPVPQDVDTNSDPLGLEATWVTGNTPRSGNLTVILKHLPNKGAINPCATGETDVEVSFPVQVF